MRRAGEGLQITQVNVGKRLECHDLALQEAAERLSSVVCIQVPWVARGWKSVRTDSSYNTYLPLQTQTKPRVVTYVRKDLESASVAVGDPDKIAVSVLGTVVWNLYRQPGLQLGDMVWPVINNKPTTVHGDFNLKHREWQEKVDRPCKIADDFEKWREASGLRHLVRNRPTHRAGNTLDLSLEGFTFQHNQEEPWKTSHRDFQSLANVLQDQELRIQYVIDLPAIFHLFGVELR